MSISSERGCARLIFRRWCEANGVVVEPLAASDLVERIAEALDGRSRPVTPFTKIIRRKASA